MRASGKAPRIASLWRSHRGDAARLVAVFAVLLVVAVLVARPSTTADPAAGLVGAPAPDFVAMGTAIAPTARVRVRTSTYR